MFSLLVAPVATVIVLVLLNAPLRRWAPKLALNQADLIIIFSLTAVAAAVSQEWSGVMFPSIHELAFEKESSNIAKDYFVKELPSWLVITDKATVEDMVGGGKDWIYVLHKMPIFLPRILAWGGLFLALCGSMLCLNSLMRDVWCRQERLTFPLIQLPVAMAEEGGGGAMWKSKHMWIAFGIMFAIDMLNGFNYLYPNVPSVPTKTIIDIGTLFKEQPLSSLGLTPIAIFPFMAAIGLFMPSDLVLSVVLFYLLRKVTHILLASQGFPQGVFSGTFIAPGPPYFDEQTWGGVLAMFVGVLVFSKGHLKEVFRSIIRGDKAEDGGIPHRWMFIGFIFCYAVIVYYGCMGDLPVLYMIAYTALFLIFSFILTRIRAQIGPPTHEFAFFGPSSFMNRFFGTKWFSNHQAAWVSQLFLSINRIHRTHPMPYQLEAMKMGSLNKLNQRTIFISVAFVTVLAFFLAYWFRYVYIYRTGNYGNWNAAETYLRNITDNKKGPDLVGITMTLFGFAVVMVMDAVRFKVPAFPIHPAGYVLSLNFGVDYYWFGLLVALMAKSFVQRYYGLRGYDRLRMVGLGILVAEYSAELIWLAMALITKQSTYTIGFNDRSLGRQ